ncbi:bifunctional 5,10-methylenetetrahydrofolate dehydrogenase/5,10-methenyltetrahydrofolate cyclohydrolase [Haloechinothrix halophila]|uniref:bifunctional 5,10-methylenetetrahydrofolate dehydrogenase/5,10-methenyltetrahydrofolate cyclohydrolase n=1 Tax=Haloechinothrix halophila TaxID=1069073 RepID=UPI0003F5964D|nr:bifunctional 5,10-methylenetetrahydrofolate dehydrogenase/5,10-methenyltetrahydrofolate cyclohydrolase [Haloechinothrix halophila]
MRAAAPGERVAARLSGSELAAALRARTADAASELAAAGTPPKLAVVVATDDESSHWYVRSIAKAATKAGLDCDVVDLGPDAPDQAIREKVAALNDDVGVHGIIVQTPLPPGVATRDVVSAIDPAKDVDGANPASLGRLAAGAPAFAPATAEAVVALLDHHGIALAGRDVVVLGRSTVVGVPVAHLLLARDASVTVCHSRTADLAAHTQRADIVIVAVGRPGLVTGEHITSDAVVVDVGTNPADDGSLVGDVDAEQVGRRAAALTPVPGGVGPVTTALLLWHTVEAARVHAGRLAGQAG